MAAVQIKYTSKKNNEVHFTLGDKENYLCKMDLDKFDKLVRNSSSYNVKECKKNGEVKSYAIARTVKNKTVFLHWEVQGEECRNGSGSVTDHINRDPVDNRLSNLRITNNSINALNSSKHDHYFPCGFKRPSGISFCWVERYKKYQIYFRSSSVKKYIGLAKDLKETVAKIKKYMEINNVENKNGI